MQVLALLGRCHSLRLHTSQLKNNNNNNKDSVQMLEMILQNFQEDNNVINVAADKEFVRMKNHIHHVLSI